MPTQPPESPQPVSLAATIRGSVLGALGRPENLYRVAVFPLWGDCYRVNVLTGPDAATAKVANSFFLVVDDAGKIVQSVPALTRQY
jgi:hypothetical protein